MISAYSLLIAALAAAGASLLFSSLTYSLRDLNRSLFAEKLGKRNADRWFEPILNQAGNLALMTAVFRQLANILIWVCLFGAFDVTGNSFWLRYATPVALGAAISLFCSVALPHAIANNVGAALVALMAAPLHMLGIVAWPLASAIVGVDERLRKMLGVSPRRQSDAIEQEIISAVEEGAAEGVVDEQEREMIESVIDLRDTTVDQIMTPRPRIVGIERGASLANVKKAIEQSGHSRIPVFEKTIDHVVGMLYVRDLLKHLGEPVEAIDLEALMRPAMFVPETKPTRELLREFRAKKVHIAVVLDEYGGVAGIVSFEDILEELVGEIADEHEPAAPPQFKRLDATHAEADAAIPIVRINEEAGLNLSEDDGYETLGGYLSTTLGRIPEKGFVFDLNGVEYTILEAAPQKIIRVKIRIPEAKPTARGAAV